MKSSSVFFLAFSALIALIGLFTAARTGGDLAAFGFGLLGFGTLFGYSVIKRHYDRTHGH
ncbi:MAG: hypothetical protein K2X11_17545 [Acetobacteraceae bacterium]|nr:hypothetical protein [Acetobacteraceae bacterium]